MKDKFAIQDYHKVEPIYEKLDLLISQPIRPVKRDKMEAYLKYFEEKCKSSKGIIAKAQEYIPGGVQHNLAFNYPFPLVFTKADGAYLYDKDGNKYIDFLQAGGPTILGSNYPDVKEKVIDLLKYLYQDISEVN